MTDNKNNRDIRERENRTNKVTDTATFDVIRKNDLMMRDIMRSVYDAFIEKGYRDPVDQIMGYLVSGEPLYITNHNKARNLICKVDRYDLLKFIINTYYNYEK